MNPHLRPCLLIALVATATAAELRRIGEGPVAVGQLVEWELDGVPAPDHHDVTRTPRLRVVRTGQAVERPAFTYRPYRNADRPATEAPEEFLPDGERSLRVRHAFRHVGAHSLSLRSPDGRELWHGRIDVEPAEGPTGPITISRANPRLLSWSDGTPYIPIGCNVAWGTRPDRLGKITGYLDALAANGGNHVRLWCASWCGGIESDEPDAYRLDQAWLLDRILAACRERGMTVLLALDNHHDLTHGKQFPYGDTPKARADAFITAELGAQYQRRIRYMIARYGADDTILAWELMNELDLCLMDQPFTQQLRDPEGRAARWTEAAASFIQAHDPDLRLVTVSLSSRPWTRVFEQPSIDLVQVHRYVPAYGLLSPVHHDEVALLDDAMAPYRELGKPICASEVGHHGTEELNPGNRADDEGALLRTQIWSGLLLGGYGVGMNWWWDVYIDERQLWDAFAPAATVIDRVDWSDPGLQPLHPNRGSSLRVLGWRSREQALLWTQIRADTWHAQAVRGDRAHFGDRGPTIRLPGMRRDAHFRIRAFDMVTGDEVWQREADADGEGRLTIALAADCGRQVLVIDLAAD